MNTTIFTNEIEISSEALQAGGNGSGHIRCLSSVPVDLEALLQEIEAEEAKAQAQK